MQTLPQTTCHDAETQPDRARSVAIAVDRHALILLGSVAIVAAALLLRNSGPRDVRLPWLEVSLPEICMWRRTTGYDCPGCGLTRSFIATAGADFSAAWAYHPLGMLLFAVVVGQIPFRAWQLSRLKRGLPEFTIRGTPWIVGLLVALLLFQWVWRFGN